MRDLRSFRSLTKRIGKQVAASIDIATPLGQHPGPNGSAAAKRQRRRQRNLDWVASGGVLRMGE